MNIKTTLKTSVAAAALFAIAAPVATPASADIANGNKNKLVVSGQVVRALYYADDGTQEQLFNSTGNTANTRVRWVASGTLNENVTAGALIEFDVQTSNTGGSFAAGSGSDTDIDKTNWSIRHQYIWVNHKQFGKVSLGATDAAANGYTEFTLAGVGGISTPSNVWTGGGIQFINTATGIATTISPGTVLSNLDFTSRTDVIRYDTPDFKGFGLSASLDGSGGGEVGGKYTGKIGPVNLIAAIGYSELSSKGNNDYNLAGSIAARHESGINASFHIGKIEADSNVANRKNQNFWAASLGYQAKVFKTGGTNMRAVYNQSRHIGVNGDDAQSWGIDVQQSFDAIGASLTLVYRNYEYENNRIGHTAIDSIDVIGLQAAFNF
ncbi:MAG: porin [Rhodospirillales bacterium]